MSTTCSRGSLLRGTRTCRNTQPSGSHILRQFMHAQPGLIPELMEVLGGHGNGSFYQVTLKELLEVANGPYNTSSSFEELYGCVVSKEHFVVQVIGSYVSKRQPSATTGTPPPFFLCG